MATSKSRSFVAPTIHGCVFIPSVFVPSSVPDLAVEDLTIAHFRLTNPAVADIFRCFPNVETLRLVNISYESDDTAITSVIRDNARVKTLILAHTNVSQAFVCAVSRLVKLVLKVDHEPYFSVTATSSWKFNRSRFEDFVARLGHLRDVELEHVTMEGEPTCGLENRTVSTVVMDPKVNVRKYFPEAEFYTF
ncbi:hypothetical protein BGZ93_003662 [Podila epicladia]|nr:hypothetical protein BGZ92_002076 [Podila epicladia]KAG0100196.1 hypothetical protein BGZ93_003662 [Podila epicladia]